MAVSILLLSTSPQALLARSASDGGNASPTDGSAKKLPPKAGANGQADPDKAAAAAKSTARFDIDEYRVEGADSLPQIDVEAAVYPFLGPGRSAEDVEKARAALEKAYHDRGLQTVGVSIPEQDATRGFVVLKVAENRVGRLRVKGSRYFDLAKIKESAPSLKEGKLPDFKAVTKDIVSLNQWPDRRVTPALRAGVTPGTVDVDLNVEDTYPLHGSYEINNRQSPSTSALRSSLTLHYDNFWQRGDSANVSYQEASLNRKDAMVVSGSYLARTDRDWLNVLLYGVKSWSSVATVGGANVIGPGQVIGARAVITLPARGDLVHNISLGADYKNFAQTLSLAGGSFSSPVNYVPLVASYGATWKIENALTQLNVAITSGTRGIGSSLEEFDAKRFKATSSFIHLKADLSHTQDLPGGVQLFAKMQGQIADQPLVSSEQFSLGGQDTVRGYLESEALGDYGAAGTLEIRSPDLTPYFQQKLENPLGSPINFNLFNDWRFYVFADAGRAKIIEPLVDQQTTFDLASYGVGTRMKMLNHFNGVFLVGVPLINQQTTIANHPRFSFRFWGEF
ncbi:ShlB/FhaC/HecB family hemolysin secretion/activation protein [Bradyrhizobium sp. HKCCYLS3077]|uniref:ShlB/FhaC/HecB family hemolysin secretion/activation protein n=1 Tax=Bradyrhizobium sp. HKCCYLS3077 TaxID=3420761 RepID=UPI003EBB6837